MTESVGRVGLDMGLNYDSFRQELMAIQPKVSGMMTGMFMKLGAIAGITLGAAAVGSFVKNSIGIASGLEEVQNVVDVTFGSMAEHINQFSKSSIETLGMSELSFKRFASTTGAMLKSSGLTGNSITGMSLEITKLTGDMASFYNLSHDEAFQKIRSGISGETEPLKQLGINMSVANLEAFALAEGIKKSYQAMSQAEQVTLRYKYLMSTTSDAQGDFIRTSDSWANQTRILSEQWRSFQGVMGDGFKSMLTPIVRGLNLMVNKLITAANYFKAFINLIFGKKSEKSGVAQANQDIADATEGAASGLGGVGKAAKDAGKDAKKSLMGFDEINNLMEETAGSAGEIEDSMGGAGNIDFGDLDITGTDAATEAMEGMFAGFREQWNSFMNLFVPEINMLKLPFETLYSNLSTLTSTYFTEMKNTASSIWTNLWAGLSAAAKPGIGLVLNIVLTFVNAINEFFTRNMESIKTVITQGWQLIETGINTVVNIIYNLIHDIFEGLLVWWIKNQEQVKNTLLNGWNTIWLGLSTVWNIIYTMAMSIFENLRIFFAVHGQAIAQVLVAAWDTLWLVISTLWNTMVNTARRIFTALKVFWDKWGDNIIAVFDWAWLVISNTFGVVLDLILGLFEIFQLAFQGDWAAAWEKTKEVGAELWEGIKKVLSTIWEGIKTVAGEIWEGIKAKALEKWDAIKTGVQDTAEDLVDAIKKPFNTAKEWIAGIIDEAYTWGKNLIGQLIDGILYMMAGLKRTLVTVANTIANFLGFSSPTKEGPGSNADKWMPNMMDMMTDGIYGKMGQFRGAVSAISTELARIETPELAYVARQPHTDMSLEDTDFIDKLMGIIATAVATANQMTSQGSSDSQQEIILEVEGVRLGRVLLPKMNSQASRLGFQPLLKYI